MSKEEFYLELEKIGIILNDVQKKQLDLYYKSLIEWNEKINLTRIIEEKDVYLKHFYDSIMLCRVYNLQKKVSICDIGTGAGFPGLVLKIVFPTLSVTLIDALQKRVTFLEDVIKKLELKDVEVIHSRGEIYAKSNREKFDIVTSRAVTQLPILCEMCIPLLKVNGLFIAMKANLNDEIEKSKDILKKIDACIVEVNEFYLPIENSIRNLVVIKKNSISNLKYPRSFDKMKKYY